MMKTEMRSLLYILSGLGYAFPYTYILFSNLCFHFFEDLGIPWILDSVLDFLLCVIIGIKSLIQWKLLNIFCSKIVLPTIGNNYVARKWRIFKSHRLPKEVLKTKIFKLKYISSEDSNDSCELRTNFESLIWGLFGDLSVQKMH